MPPSRTRSALRRVSSFLSRWLRAAWFALENRAGSVLDSLVPQRVDNKPRKRGPVLDILRLEERSQPDDVGSLIGPALMGFGLPLLANPLLRPPQEPLAVVRAPAVKSPFAETASNSSPPPAIPSPGPSALPEARPARGSTSPETVPSGESGVDEAAFRDWLAADPLAAPSRLPAGSRPRVGPDGPGGLALPDGGSGGGGAGSRLGNAATRPGSAAGPNAVGTDLGTLAGLASAPEDGSGFAAASILGEGDAPAGSPETPVTPLPQTVQPTLAEDFGRGIPLIFEQNVGQTDESVAFVSRNAGVTLFISADGATFSAGRADAPVPVRGPVVLGRDDPETRGANSREDDQPEVTRDVFRLKFEGANPNATVVGRDPLVTRTNYFAGPDRSDWHTDVPTFSTVVVQNLYDGIDLVWHGLDGTRQLEYDLVVRPGANPADIRMSWEGLEEIEEGEDGGLVLRTAGGAVRQLAPVAYQEGPGGTRTTVPASSGLADGGSVTFGLGEYDPTKPLVIDPALVFSTYLGGSGGDHAAEVWLDPGGSIFVAGTTTSVDLPPTPGPLTPGGDFDAFVTKLTPDGRTVLFTSVFGGSAHDVTSDMAVDASGNIYLVGSSASPDFSTTAGALRETGGGGYDLAFLTRLSAAGNVLTYSTLFGDGDDDPALDTQGWGLAVSGSRYAYLTGYTDLTVPTTPGAYRTDEPPNYWNSYLAKIDTHQTGEDALVYSTYLGNDTVLTWGQQVVLGPDGTAYVVGGTTDGFDVTGGAFQGTFGGGGQDGLVVRVSADGSSLLYASYLGGDGDDEATAVSYLAGGVLHVGGWSDSTDLATGGAFQEGNAGGKDGFVGRVAAGGGSLTFLTYLGGEDDDYVAEVRTDPDGRPVAVGRTASEDFPLEQELYDYAGGANDAFASRLASDGTALAYSTLLGGSGDDVALSVALDGFGNALVTGYTASTDMPVVNPYQGSLAGSGTYDAFLAKILTGPAPPALTSVSTDSGASNTDRITTDQTLTFAGTTTATAVVKVYRTDVGYLGTATNTAGSWSYAYGTTLPEGSYAFRFTAEDGGLTSDYSTPYTVVVDLTAPAVTATIAATTFDLTPDVTVAASDAVGFPAGAVVTLDVDLNNDNDFVDADEAGYATGTLSAASVVISLLSALGPALTEGNTYKVRARVTDKAGNQGTSATQTFEIDEVLTPWDTGGETKTADPLRGDPLLAEGTLRVAVPLDLDLSPGTSVGGSALVYNSDRVDVRPIVRAEIQTDNTIPLPPSITVQLTWDGGSPQTPQTFYTDGLSPGDLLTFAQRVDAAVTTTGRYAYTLDVTMDYEAPDDPIERQVTGWVLVVAEDDGAFGSGWTLGTTDRLVEVEEDVGAGLPAGVVRVYGSGGASFYEDAGGGAYDEPDGDAGTLAAIGGDPANGFTYTAPDGSVRRFDAAGKQTRLVGGNGSETTTFTYSGSDLTGIATADGALTTLTYDSGKVETIQTGSRAVTLSYDGDELTGVTQPDGSSAAFDYGSGARMTSSSVLGVTATYGYTAGVLSSWTEGSGQDAGAYGLVPVSVQGLGELVSGTVRAGVTNPVSGLAYATLDGQGRLKSYEQPGGTGVWTYTRDAQGRVTGVVDPVGRSTAYTLDGSGYATVETLPGAGTLSHSYDSTHHNLTRTIDALGRVTSYSYSSGNLTQSIDALGNTRNYAYSNGLLTAAQDALGNLTSYAYDAARRLTKVLHPDGGVETLTYDTNGNLATRIDPLGRTTSFLNDPLGKTTRTIDPLGRVGTSLYDAGGRLTQSIDPAGVATLYQYDTRGRQTSAVDAYGTPLERSRLTTFDAAGRAIQERDFRGNSTVSAFDPAGRLTGRTDPLDNTSASTFDRAGQLLSSEDPLHRVTQYQYDSAGRRTRTIDPLGFGGTTTFDLAGNALSRSDALGRVTSYLYDALGRLTQTTAPLSGGSSTFYDAEGNVTKSVNALGAVYTTLYDAMGRRTASIDPLGGRTTVLFDKAGDLTESVDALGRSTLFEFDSGGRQTATVNALGFRSTSLYDTAGNLTKSIDPLGRAVTYLYDSLRQRTVTIDALGNQTVSVYDAAGQATGSTNGLDNTWQTAYDALGRRVQSADPAGGTRRWEYDEAGNVLKEVNELGKATAYAYDPLNRPTAVTDPLGNVTTALYDEVGSLLAGIDPLGNRTSYLYDALGRLTQTTDAAGGLASAVYDPTGNLRAGIDPLGRRTSYVYDALGRLTGTTDPLGLGTATAYDAAGNITAVTDRRGFVTTYSYDDANRRTRTQDALGTLTTFLYDAVGNQTGTIDSRGNRTTWAYDARDRLTASTDALGKTTTSVHDGAGNLVRTIDPLGKILTYLYDSLNRLTATQDAAGGGTQSAYDAAGNLVNTSDGADNETSFVYDTANRKVGTIDAEGGVTTYLLDARGNQTGLVDSVGNHTTFLYDALGRRTAEVDPLGKTLTYAYDAAGQQTQTIDRLGRTRNYFFDAADRQTKETWVENSSTVNTLTFTYDAAGNRLTALDKNGAYTYAYDAAGRVTGEGEPFGFTRTLSYDAAGNRTRAEDSFGAITTSVYDAANRLTSRRLGGSGTPLRLDEEWDGRGLLATITRYADVGGTTKVGDTLYQYDGAGRITHLTHRDGTATTLSELTYAYDPAGRLTTQVEDGSPTTYGYDQTGQLTNANATAYSYDANGNRDTGGYAVGAGNRMTNDGIWTYTYDFEGNRTKKSKGTTLETWTFGYDHRNQMTWAEQRSTDGGTLLLKLEYKYDVDGKRLEEARWTSATGTVTTRFAYDGDDVAVDLDGSNVLAARYLRPDGIDALGGRVKAGGAAAFYLTDRQGTVKALTDATGAVIDQLTYDAFGRVVAETSAANGDRYTYTGRERQSDTGLQYNRNRWYDTANGRWTTEDPIRYEGGDSNLARYTHNRPVNAIDPLGLRLIASPRSYKDIQAWLAGTSEYLVPILGPSPYIETRVFPLPVGKDYELIPTNLKTASEKVQALIAKERGTRTPELAPADRASMDRRHALLASIDREVSDWRDFETWWSQGELKHNIPESVPRRSIKSVWEKIRMASKARDLPTGLIDAIESHPTASKVTIQAAEGGGTYDPWWKTLTINPAQWNAIQFPLKRPDTQDIGHLYNELFHVFYNEIVKTTREARWIGRLMEDESHKYYELITKRPLLEAKRRADAEEMVEEAMSEMMASFPTRTKTMAAFGGTANEVPRLSRNGFGSPQHNQGSVDGAKAGKWNEKGYYDAAATPVTPTIRNLTLWILFHGYDKPATNEKDIPAALEAFWKEKTR